jgi:hypothetical protein
MLDTMADKDKVAIDDADDLGDDLAADIEAEKASLRNSNPLFHTELVALDREAVLNTTITSEVGSSAPKERVPRADQDTLSQLLDKCNVARCCDSWSKECSSSINALHWARSSDPQEKLFYSSTSLMLWPVSEGAAEEELAISLVFWDNPDKFIGRLVRVDEQNRVVCSLPATRRSFQELFTALTAHTRGQARRPIRHRGSHHVRKPGALR